LNERCICDVILMLIVVLQHYDVCSIVNTALYWPKEKKRKKGGKTRFQRTYTVC